MKFKLTPKMTAHLLKRTTNGFKCGVQVSISVGHRGRAKKSNERLGAKCRSPPPKRVRGSSSAADAAVVIPVWNQFSVRCSRCSVLREVSTFEFSLQIRPPPLLLLLLLLLLRRRTCGRRRRGQRMGGLGGLKTGKGSEICREFPRVTAFIFQNADKNTTQKSMHKHRCQWRSRLQNAWNTPPLQRRRKKDSGGIRPANVHHPQVTWSSQPILSSHKIEKVAPWKRCFAEEEKIAEAQAPIPLPKIQIIILCVHLQL